MFIHWNTKLDIKFLKNITIADKMVRSRNFSRDEAIFLFGKHKRRTSNPKIQKNADNFKGIFSIQWLNIL